MNSMNGSMTCAEVMESVGQFPVSEEPAVLQVWVRNPEDPHPRRCRVRGRDVRKPS